jgi:hypothetical protein
MHKSTGSCAATGRAFTPGETHIAALVDEPGRGLARMDFGVDAWESGTRPPAPFQLIGFWRAHYQPHQQPAKQLMGDDELLEMFDGLANVSDPKQVRFRYVLALLLIRRRMLRVVGQRRGVEGVTMQVYRQGESAGDLPPTPVLDPGLDEVSIAEAIEQLTALVDGPDASTPPTQASEVAR